MKKIALVAAVALSFSGGAMLANAQTNDTAPPAASSTPSPATAPAAEAGGGRMAGIQQACAADFQKLCPGMTPGDGKLGPCIRANLDKLSPSCRGALSSMRGQRRFSRQ